MISVAVKVETACGACRMPMPVNTLAREVRCPSCGRPTAVGDDLWKALLRDPLYNGPRLLANEVRRSSAGKLSAAYMRRGPRCQGCDSEIPVERVREVREQATLRCERCAVQTWVRAVPAELAGALPNVTHLVGEDPDPTAMAPAGSAEAATFPCPQCGSPVPFDGVTRACTCRFCSASVHVPDEFVYRGRRKAAATWYLCFHPSIVDRAPAAQAVAAGLFDWADLPEVVVDAAGNLYCAATQQHWFLDQDDCPTDKLEYVLWSVDPSLKVRWIQRDRPQRAERLVLSPKGVLLVIGGENSPATWISCDTGAHVGELVVTAERAGDNVLVCDHITCDRDGSLLPQKDGKLRRIAPNGVSLPVWPNGAPSHDSPVRDVGSEGEESGGDDDQQSGRSGGVTLDISARGVLLATHGENSTRAWLPFESGTPAERAGAARDMSEVGLPEQAGSPLLTNPVKPQQRAALGVASPGGPDGAARDQGDADADTDWAGSPARRSQRKSMERSDSWNMPSACVDCGPDGSIYLRNGGWLARFDVNGRRNWRVEFSYDSAFLLHHAFGADASGNAYMLGKNRLMRITAAGEQNVVLDSERDGLPRESMRIAVCPGGSFWLFGANGRAWYFDERDTLIFASEKEPRPRKSTIDELSRQRGAEPAAQAQARAEELLRAYHAQVDAEDARRRWTSFVFLSLCIVAAFAWAMYGLWSD